MTSLKDPKPLHPSDSTLDSLDVELSYTEHEQGILSSPKPERE